MTRSQAYTETSLLHTITIFKFSTARTLDAAWFCQACQAIDLGAWQLMSPANAMRACLWSMNKLVLLLMNKWLGIAQCSD